MRSMARWVLPVLVGPSTAVTPAPRAWASRFIGDEKEIGIFIQGQVWDLSCLCSDKSLACHMRGLSCAASLRRYLRRRGTWRSQPHLAMRIEGFFAEDLPAAIFADHSCEGGFEGFSC